MHNRIRIKANVRAAQCILFCWALFLGRISEAQDEATSDLVSKVVAAAGGESKLLKLFRIKERLNVSADPSKPGNERVSLLEPPNYWWVGKKERVKEEKEPAIFLVWAWTLGTIVDAQSKLELLPNLTDGEATLLGLRISQSITPPMDLYFDRTTQLLARIDWRSDVHRFSDYEEHDGVKYPSKCVGYKKASGKPWYFTHIVELERLRELPAEYKR